MYTLPPKVIAESASHEQNLPTKSAHWKDNELSNILANRLVFNGMLATSMRTKQLSHYVHTDVTIFRLFLCLF